MDENEIKKRTASSSINCDDVFMIPTNLTIDETTDEIKPALMLCQEETFGQFELQEEMTMGKAVREVLADEIERRVQWDWEWEDKLYDWNYLWHMIWASVMLFSMFTGCFWVAFLAFIFIVLKLKYFKKLHNLEQAIESAIWSPIIRLLRGR